MRRRRNHFITEDCILKNECITTTHDTKKTKKFKLKKLFRPTPSLVKEKDIKVNLSLLKKLATTKNKRIF